MGAIILVLCCIILLAACVFFKGPAVIDFFADVAAMIACEAEKAVKAALRRWRDILEG